MKTAQTLHETHSGIQIMRSPRNTFGVPGTGRWYKTLATARIVADRVAAIRNERTWACQECGRKLTLKQAERASRSTMGCPSCGGADIDLI